MMALKEIVILAGLVAVVLGMDCTSNSDCSPDECCVQFETRESHPQCVSRINEGDSCRPGPPTTLNETYIVGRLIPLDGVYSRMCPCKQNLYCKTPEGVCSR